MEKWKGQPTICRQCKKDIKTELIKCVPCEKVFHPSCHRLHRVYNAANELVPCKGKVETYVLKQGATAEGSGDKRRASGDPSILSGGDSSPAPQRCISTDEVSMDAKIGNMYKLLKEIKDEMMGRDLIKGVIREILEEEMNNVVEW